MLKQLQKCVSRLLNPRAKRVTLGAKILTLLLIGIVAVVVVGPLFGELRKIASGKHQEGFEGQKGVIAFAYGRVPTLCAFNA